MPQARQYAQEWFVSEPVYLLQYVVRPAAIVLFGLAVVEAVRELAGIRIWSGKSDKSREIVRIVFCVLAVCLSVAVAFCRMEKGESEKESENRMG